MPTGNSSTMTFYHITEMNVLPIKIAETQVLIAATAQTAQKQSNNSNNKSLLNQLKIH